MTPTVTTVRCLDHGPAPGARNMAVDEALMSAARSGEVTLRFYGWRPACLSLGRNQRARGRYDRDAAARRGIDIVRRPTGGRAVYHDRELTYAVTAPAGLWGGLRPSYRRINRALLRGLSLLGAPVEEASGGGRSPGPSLRACFQDALDGEIQAGGRKLVGSAQWREDGVLLQHGSVLLHDDQRVARELRREEGSGVRGGEGRRGDRRPQAARPAGSAVRAAALGELLEELPDLRTIRDALRRGFAEELGVTVRRGELRPEEEERARGLVERYAGADWTWRR